MQSTDLMLMKILYFSETSGVFVFVEQNGAGPRTSTSMVAATPPTPRPRRMILCLTIYD